MLPQFHEVKVIWSPWRMKELSGYSAAVLSPDQYSLVDVTLLTRAIPMVATGTGPHLPLWPPHLAVLLWEGASDLTGWIFGSLRPSFLVQPFLNAAFNLSFSWRVSSLTRHWEQSLPISPFPSCSWNELHRFFSVFVYKAIIYIVLYHKSNRCLWWKQFSNTEK